MNRKNQGVRRRTPNAHKKHKRISTKPQRWSRKTMAKLEQQARDEDYRRTQMAELERLSQTHMLEIIGA